MYMPQLNRSTRLKYRIWSWLQELENPMLPSNRFSDWVSIWPWSSYWVGCRRRKL